MYLSIDVDPVALASISENASNWMLMPPHPVQLLRHNTPFPLMALLTLFQLVSRTPLLDWNSMNSLVGKKNKLDSRRLATGDNATDEYPSKCYDYLGCVEVTDKWYHPFFRPVNLLPLDRNMVNTLFLLHTRENQEKEDVITAEDTKTISGSHFNAKKPIKFIVHGFIDTGYATWLLDMTKALLRHGDYNVIRVDWGGGSLPLYTQATANTRLVALELAYLIKHLIKNYGIDPGNIHIIGHSLGSHIAGYVGEKIRGLGRITGLDPAEPYFQYMPRMIRLDPSDANFVDVIHTDSKNMLFLALPLPSGYGMVQKCGHADFYPNNGHEQPGCALSQVPLTAIVHGMEEAGRELVACSHQRAVNLFLSSLSPSACPFVGYECHDYDAFVRGECFQCGRRGKNETQCAPMGMDAIHFASEGREEVAFYLKTYKDPPYCLFHYHMTVETARLRIASNWVTGRLRASVFGDKADLESVSLTESNIRVDHGKSYKFLLTSAVDLGKVSRVELFWDYDFRVMDPRSICLPILCNDHLYVAKVEVRDLTHRSQLITHTSSFSGRSDSGFVNIKSGSRGIFVEI